MSLNISRVKNIQDGCGRVRGWLRVRGHNFISLEAQRVIIWSWYEVVCSVKQLVSE